MVEKYKIMSPGEANKLEGSFTSLVKYWHDSFRPDYVFLNETSAVPWGYILKNAWKEAYPKEVAPKFFRINPAVLIGRVPYRNYGILRSDDWLSKSWMEYLNKRVKNKNARIAVYDETQGAVSSSWVKFRLEKPFTERKISYEKKQEFESKFGLRGDISLFSGSFEGKNIRMGSPRREEERVPNENHYMGDQGSDLWSASNVTQKSGNANVYNTANKVDKYFLGGKVKFTGDLIKSPQRRRNALDYIHDLKIVGAKLGEKIRREKEQRNGLEKLASASVSIISLISGILFLSSSITANVIGSFSRNYSGLAGILLFLVGIIAAAIYFKKK